MDSTTRLLAAGMMVVALGACSGMSTRDRNTAVGAAAGALTGSALTGGDALGTVGGAIVGGAIGHEVRSGHDSRR